MIDSPAAVICPVRWSDIDISAWDAGWYLMAFVTADSFDNAGIAPLVINYGAGSDRTRNPQRWRIEPR